MKTRWLKVLEPDSLPDGRVTAVTCEHRTLCMSHYKGSYAALDNRCPHQGGPLAEGSIENGMLRCPWHGWDFDPLTGESPAGFDEKVESFPVDVRDDGIYVEFPVTLAHEITRSDVIAQTLTKWGVKWVWGMVGHSNLGFADALRREEEKGNLRFFGIRHEGAASFAASAYGKLTGKAAACFAIAGPGATNLLTGLWDAHVDRAPVLAITGQVPTKLIGRGAFQEVDLASAFGGVAHYSAVVQSHTDAAEVTSLACKNALIKRGVSHLVLPDDVQTMPADGEATGPEGRVGDLRVRPPESALENAIAALKECKRPAIVVGHGAREGMDEVIRLAEKLNAPVLTTFKAKGQISDKHPLGCGVLGRSGTPVASWFMNEADLLLVFGASFSNHTGITSYKKIVQVDFDPMALGRFHKVDVPVLGHVGVTAKLLAESVDENDTVDVRPEVQERWKIWREEKSRRESEHKEGAGLHSAAVFSALTEAVSPNAIITVDVGNNAYSFGRYFECDNQRVLLSGYLGSIGFGIPAAMGAWAATQEAGTPFSGRQVVAVTGDGGFAQYLAEYTTLAKYKMNVTHVLLNNAELGKISKEQRAGNFDVWQTSLKNPSFFEFAESCGLKAWHVTTAAELPAALKAALDHDGPSMVEILSDVKGL